MDCDRPSLPIQFLIGKVAYLSFTIFEEDIGSVLGSLLGAIANEMNKGRIRKVGDLRLTTN
jgi:hypothetical protein